MSLTMYQASVPVFIRQLHNLSAILTKAVAHADARAEATSLLIEARLAPDMFPLARQIQIASDTAKGAGARLAGVDVPSFEDKETTFPNCRIVSPRRSRSWKACPPTRSTAARTARWL